MQNAFDLRGFGFQESLAKGFRAVLNRFSHRGEGIHQIRTVLGGEFRDLLKRHDGPTSPDLIPLADPPVRNVKQIDKQFVGVAPGLDDGADPGVRLQLPILGDLTT